MRSLRRFWVWYIRRKKIRPWGLTASILVLLVALPLLRPLRHPDPTTIADDETVRLATIQAIVEHDTLAIDDLAPRGIEGTTVVEGHRYATQPPMFAAVLSAAYRPMRAWWGLSLADGAVLAPYLLTVLGVTLPVALAGGILYRMARLFELSRPWRMVLALGVIFGGGLISYATVLNAHAPAAVLILGSSACLLHLGTVKNPMHSGAWLVLAGLCAAMGTTLEPTAGVFFLLFIAVIFTYRWTPSLRLGGALLYLLGAGPPLLLHVVLTMPVFGSALPINMVLPTARPAVAATLSGVAGPGGAPAPESAFFIDAPEQAPADSMWLDIGRWMGRLLEAMLGAHGLLSHFPILIVAMLGCVAVMHRHWPTSTKTLAVIALAGAAVVVLCTVSGRSDWRGAMFASRWFVVFLPLVVFWAGAWLRRGHRRGSWALASAATAFSVVVSVVGASNPYPRGGFDSYTALAAWQSWTAPSPPLPRPLPAAAVARGEI